MLLTDINNNFTFCFSIILSESRENKNLWGEQAEIGSARIQICILASLLNMWEQYANRLATNPTPNNDTFDSSTSMLSLPKYPLRNILHQQNGCPNTNNEKWEVGLPQVVLTLLKSIMQERVLWFYYNPWWPKYFIFLEARLYLRFLTLIEILLHIGCPEFSVIHQLSINSNVSDLRSLRRNKNDTKRKLFTHSKSIKYEV